MRDIAFLDCNTTGLDSLYKNLKMQLSIVRLICINLCTQKSFVTTRHAKKSASNTWACKPENASTENATAKRST